MINSSRRNVYPSIVAVLICLMVAFALPVLALEESPAPTPISQDRSALDAGVEVTRWIDPQGRAPISYAQWRASQPELSPLEADLKLASVSDKSGRNGTKLCIIVNADLYPSIQTSLDEYVLDLTGELYEVELYTSSGGSPEEMRAWLQQLYAAGMAGCVLIGDLPVAWFETWCWEEPPDPAEHEQFPCDLFYMDLDGDFTDSDVNGMYELHTGDIAPEIYVGRLTASVINMGGNEEVPLLVNYFAKNHLYRCGLMGVTNRALVYIDDDWSGGGAGWDLDVGSAYNSRTTELDNWTTWASDYVSRLPLNYEFIQLCAHSAPWVHAFKNPSEQWSYTYNGEILALDPTAVFYNLFACSNSRFVENDNMGGIYIFCQTYGLASIGSSKTGSMLDFGSFYRPFGDGASIGEAFRDWFAAQAASGMADWQTCWYYGMTLQGDPTLTAQKKATGDMLQYDIGSASYMSAIADGTTWDHHNVRFTPTALCTLAAVTIEGYFPGAPAARLYLYNTDGTYPTSVIDSVDLPSGSFPASGTKIIDVSEQNWVFYPGQDFHIGIDIVEPTPADTLWIYMDAGVTPDEHRSVMNENGTWRTMNDVYGWDYNFLIRAIVHTQAEPTVAITTLTIPDGQAGAEYDVSIDVEGGTPPYSWDITAGSLPTGLSIDPSAGKLVGTPTSSGDYPFTVRATDSDDPAHYDVQHLAMTVTFLCADLNSDGNAADIGDLVYLVDWMFNEGPSPTVMAAADVDGSGGAPDIGDLVYLVDYMFNGGPGPECFK